jgi:hypothetical protein
MKKQLLMVCILVFGSIQGYCAEQTQELKAFDDAYIYRGTTGTGDEIRGLEPFVYSYHSTAGSQYRRETFLRFDISGLSPFIETIKLRMYADLKEAHTFNLYPVTKTDWVEDDLSANNKLEKLGADVTTVYTTAATDIQGMGAKYYEWDVTSIVKDSINANVQFIAFRMRDRDVVKTAAGAGVIVNWHAKENASGFYPHLQYTEKDISTLRLQSILLNASIIDGFVSNKYKYNVTLPWNATIIPTVTAIPIESNSTLSIIPAVNLSGSESERTTKITVTNTAGSLTYSVVFQLSAQPNNADLLSVSADGKPIVSFDKNTTNYTLNVPHGWVESTPFTAQSADQNATVSIKLPTNLQGSESEKTAVITCKSANGLVEKQYHIVVNRLPEMDIVLAMGQSQMAGRASYAAEGTDPIPDVYLLNGADFMELATNPMNRYANISKSVSAEALSPAFTFVKKVQQKISRPIGIMVNAQGGSSISVWYQPGKSNYDASVKRIREIAKYGTVKGIIWHQGSADNSKGLADNFVSYKSNMKTMVENFRKELNLPNLPFICGELTDGRPEFDAFNQTVIQDVKSYIPNSDFVYATGVTLLSDGIHFDTPSVKMMGERYADKFLEMVYGITSINKKPISEKNIQLSVKANRLQMMAITESVSANIYDIQGRRLAHFSLQAGENKTQTVSDGLYLVSVNSNSNQSVYKVLVSY